jgi:hypothetical protein
LNDSTFLKQQVRTFENVLDHKLNAFKHDLRASLKK